MKARLFPKLILTTALVMVLGAAGLFDSKAFAQNVNCTYRIDDPNKLAEAPVNIETEWDFFWKKNVSDPDSDIRPDLHVKVPSDWNDYNLAYDDAKIVSTGKGSGTYRLKITNLKPLTNYAFPVYELCYTAFIIYANGREIYCSGRPNVKWEKTHAEQYFDKAVFTSDEKGSVVLSIFISNDYYRKGGFRGDFQLSEEEVYIQNYTSELCLYGIFTGLLLTIALYCLLTALMKKDRTNLYLAVLVLGIISRIITEIFPLLKEMFPYTPFTVMLRLEYCSLFVIPSMHTLYFDSLNKKIFGRYAAKIIAAPASVFLILDFVLPIQYANRLVPYIQIYMFSVAVIDIVLTLIRFIKDKDFISGTAIFSFVVLGIGAVIAVLARNHINIGDSGQILAITLVIYSLSQIALLAYIQNRNYMKVVELNAHLGETNKAYFRFVPKEFLKLLSKKDITEVELGEYKVAKMAVLSADIRNFTSTSEKLSPIQVFDMLNSYLGRIAPLIRKYNGLIEKYLGDGIIALFPENAVSALNCAVEMQEQMIELRDDFLKKRMPLIKIGIGVHYGNIVIGTGGANERMTEISLSDDIDIAIKIEAATKIYDRKILVTEQVLNRAAAEVRAQGKKFTFSGEKVEIGAEAETPQLYALYTNKIGKVL